MSLSSDSLTAPNSVSALRAEHATQHLSWTWPLLFTFLRFPLLALGFLAAMFVVHVTGGADAPNVAQAFTRFDMPLGADIICLVLLRQQLHREGPTLRQLIMPTRRFILRDLITSFGIILPTAILGGGLTVLFIFMARAPLGTISEHIINPLGLPWHILISMLILPITSGITEELVYRGYALPRLVALTGRRWQGIAIMASGFGLQHAAFVLTDWRLAIVSAIGLACIGAGFGIAYFVNKQRLLPLMLLHWQSDLLTFGAVPLLLYFLFK